MHVSTDQLNEIKSNASFQQVSLILSCFDENIQDQGTFNDTYSNQIIIEVGGESQGSLFESWFAFKTDDKVAIPIWREIAKDVRVRTQVGGVISNLKMGVESFDKRIRYTKSAKHLQDLGIKMRPFSRSSNISVKLGKNIVV